MLRLPSGEYLGRNLRRARSSDLPMTLTAYPPGHTYPWHVHEIPTLFVLLAGQHHDENPHGHQASWSPDGARLAYMPQGDQTFQRKNYRGGTHSRIWILNLKDHAVEQLPQPAGSFNDIGPRWMEGTIYFRSDRNGESNLFAYDTKTKAVRQLTAFDDFPVVNLDEAAASAVSGPG